MDKISKRVLLKAIEELPKYATNQQRSTFIRNKLVEHQGEEGWLCEVAKSSDVGFEFGDYKPDQYFQALLGADTIRVMLLTSQHTPAGQLEAAKKDIAELQKLLGQKILQTTLGYV